MTTSERAALDPARLATLAAVLDTLVPPDLERGMPGAGALGLAAPLAETLGATESLGAALDLLASAAGGDLAALSQEEREALLREAPGLEPGLVRNLVMPTFVAYYEHPEVVAALGLEARPPYPRGYDLAPGDLGLLDPVRRRAPLYREP